MESVGGTYVYPPPCALATLRTTGLEPPPPLPLEVVMTVVVFVFELGVLDDGVITMGCDDEEFSPNGIGISDI
jgi:hypothetical protein